MVLVMNSSTSGQAPDSLTITNWDDCQTMIVQDCRLINIVEDNDFTKVLKVATIIVIMIRMNIND